MIHLRNVSQVYPNGTAALQGITLELTNDRFTAMIGASGAGKHVRLAFYAQGLYQSR